MNKANPPEIHNLHGLLQGNFPTIILVVHNELSYVEQASWFIAYNSVELKLTRPQKSKRVTLDECPISK